MSWLARSEQKHRYLVIMLKSGLCINAKFSSEISAKEAMRKIVTEYYRNPHAAIVIGDQPAPLLFMPRPEISAVYVSSEPGR